MFGTALSVAAWGLKVITFGNPVWLGVIALCVVVGLSSNGVYDVQFIRNWIETWFKPAAALLNKENAETIEKDFVEAVATNKPVEEKPLKVKRVRKTEPENTKA